MFPWPGMFSYVIEDPLKTRCSPIGNWNQSYYYSPITDEVFIIINDSITIDFFYKY